MKNLQCKAIFFTIPLASGTPRPYLRGGGEVKQDVWRGLPNVSAQIKKYFDGRGDGGVLSSSPRSYATASGRIKGRILSIDAAKT